MTKKGYPAKHPNIPLAPVIGVAAGIGIPALGAWKMGAGKGGDERVMIILDQVGQSIYGYSAVNQKWYTGNMTRFWAPVAGGTFAHVIASKIGLNRILARFKLGFVI